MRRSDRHCVAVQAQELSGQQADDLRRALAEQRAEAAAELEAVRSDLVARQEDAAADVDLLQVGACLSHLLVGNLPAA